ncbi:hypothetical protein FRB98_004764 [Tulasnella sp. 332]|nr:hypothetical protein FRB98_004764 [Tulasnella sp. 332]
MVTYTWSDRNEHGLLDAQYEKQEQRGEMSASLQEHDVLQDTVEMTNVIDRLPTELLIKILLEVLPSEVSPSSSGLDPEEWPKERSFQFYTRLYTCLRVSKYWRDVIEQHGPFWTIVDYRFPDAIWTAALTRSQACPLAVYMRKEQSLRLRGDILDSSDFVATAGQHSYRWHTAALEIQWGQDLVILNELEMPSLSSLWLDMKALTDWTVDLHLSELRAPQVKHVYLAYARLTLPIFSGLHSLRLTSASFPSMASLASALRNSPDLQLLKLLWPEFDSHEVSKPTHLPAVKLDRLSSLKLYGRGRDISRLLDIIQTPNLRKSVVFTSCDPDTHSQTIESLCSRGERSVTIQTLLFQTGQLTIDIDGDTSVNILVGPEDDSDGDEDAGGNTLRMMFYYISARKLLIEWVIPVLRPLAFDVSVKVKARACFGDLSARETLEVFRSIHGVEVLELGDNLDEVLPELSHPRDEDGVLIWTCPRLHTLLLEGCEYTDSAHILCLIEARGQKTDVDADVGERDDNRPVLLRDLRVSANSRICSETWERITAILGDGATWT